MCMSKKPTYEELENKVKMLEEQIIETERKHKKYVVINRLGAVILCKWESNGISPCALDFGAFEKRDDSTYKLTADEIKSYDERYMEFAKPLKWE